MAFIKLFKFQESTGLLKKEYEKGLRRAGRIWNILTIQSQTPEILRDSMRLYNSTMFGNLEINTDNSLIGITMEDVIEVDEQLDPSITSKHLMQEMYMGRI